MTLYRCFAWNQAVPHTEPDGPLWFPRPYQGEGRHDHPDVYGCLYLAERELSCIVEQLARFRGQARRPSFLRRRGLPLALAVLDLADTAELIDLDEPATLRRTRLNPSVVATRVREVTQSYARAMHERHPNAAGLRWWSIHEASWINVTLFDRAAAHLRLTSVRELRMDEEVVAAAADIVDI